MADDIRIKDLQSTASYMESDDYLPIDGLALGNRKIPFTGLMDSEDDRLPTTDKTLRGAIDEHEDDISEIKQSLSVKETTPSFNTQAITDSASDPSFIQKSGNTVTVFLNFSASATVTAWSTLIGTLPSGYRPPKTIFPLGKIGNNIATLRVGSDGGILSSVGMSSGNSANISFTFMTS